MAGKIKHSRVWMVVYFVVLTLVVIVAAGFIAYFLQSGENNTSFSVTIEGKDVESGSSVGVLTSGSKIDVEGAEEYEVAVYACSSENDFAFTVDGEEFFWNDIDGRNMSAGFEIVEADDGFTISYVGIEDIISDVQDGAEVSVGEFPKDDIFRLSVTTSTSRIDMYFSLLMGVFLDKTEIIF